MFANTDATLKPPSIDSSTPQGKQNRRKLLRAWIELGSWISDFKRVNGKQLTANISYTDSSVNQHGILQNGRSTNCMCNWIVREKCTKLPLVPTLIKVSIHAEVSLSVLIACSSQRRTVRHDDNPGPRYVLENAWINVNNLFGWFVLMFSNKCFLLMSSRASGICLSGANVGVILATHRHTLPL
jgi:hypothetical protein